MSTPPVTFPTASAHADPRQQHGDDNPSLTWSGKSIKASDGYSALVRIIMFSKFLMLNTSIFTPSSPLGSFTNLRPSVPGPSPNPNLRRLHLTAVTVALPSSTPSLPPLLLESSNRQVLMEVLREHWIVLFGL